MPQEPLSQSSNVTIDDAATGDVATDNVYDLIGIGFGPANLALAIALEEATAEPPLKHLFLEAKPSYVWHPGMLIKDSLLQLNVLKDLVMLHNPRSRYTFLNYLKEKDRLVEFLNLKDLFPTRLEFNDYLTWAAGELACPARYSREVKRVLPVSGSGDDGVELLRVEALNHVSGELETYLTRNLVVATGGEPTTPDGIDLVPEGRAFHSHYFLDRIAPYDDPTAALRCFVIGSGQSAAEIFLHLINSYERADVTATIRRFAYKPADDSDFTNTIFFPEWVDFHYNLPTEKRRPFFDSLKDVNYAVIDHPLIHSIYKALYRMKVVGDKRARIRPFLHLEGLTEYPDRVVGHFRDLMTEEAEDIEADLAVICTGYVWRKEHPLLTALDSHFERDDRDGYRVARDYRIEARNGFRPNVYLQGYCEDTHGISETVLSLLPVRAQDILRSLLAARAQREAVFERGN